MKSEAEIRNEIDSVLRLKDTLSVFDYGEGEGYLKALRRIS